MIGPEELITQISGLQREDLERWILNEWIRPDHRDGRYMFHEIDVARVQLILELRDEMQVNEEAMPVVLSLLDQLYGMRRRLRELVVASGEPAPDNLRKKLAAILRSTSRATPDDTNAVPPQDAREG